MWLASWHATFDFEPGHPDEDVRRWLATELVPQHETWVAVDADGIVVALMALSDEMIVQLYVAPAWIGRGLGRRLIALAKERRPAGLDLYCFAVNSKARDFYERQGFTADRVRRRQRQRGAAAGRPVRVAAGPMSPAPPEDAPTRTVRSRDGTPIAVFASGTGPPLLLVHGAAADHTTFRVLGPLLAAALHHRRRSTGAAGARRATRALRHRAGVRGSSRRSPRRSRAKPAVPVDVFGHSYGGRCALGAALLTGDIGRVIWYEGAPTPPGESYGDEALAAELAALAGAGRNGTLLATFMTASSA